MTLYFYVPGLEWGTRRFAFNFKSIWHHLVGCNVRKELFGNTELCGSECGTLEKRLLVRRAIVAFAVRRSSSWRSTENGDKPWWLERDPKFRCKCHKATEENKSFCCELWVMDRPTFRCWGYMHARWPQYSYSVWSYVPIHEWMNVKSTFRENQSTCWKI
jgi:hypothetical protein